MKQDKEKMTHHKGVMKWEAVIGKNIDIGGIRNSKLYCRHNTKDSKIQGIYGCLQSHLGLLKHMVDEKINNVCVLEDDSESDFEIPQELINSNHITYIGGWLVNKKMKDIKLPVEEKKHLKEGINELKSSRVLTTRAYYIPKWEHAEGLLNYIKEKKTWKAIDIMMSEYVKHLYYPALSHQILGYKSTIGNFSPKIKYEYY